MTKQQRDTFEGHIEQAMKDAKTSSPDALVTGKKGDFDEAIEDARYWKAEARQAQRQRDALLEACKRIYEHVSECNGTVSQLEGEKLHSAIALAEKEGK